MKRILVVNHAHSEVCGIHDLGKRMYGCLMRSNDLAVIYADCDSVTTFTTVVDLYDPDAVIINYRADLTPWATAPVDPPTFAVLHQYEEATADARAGELLRYFDHVLALDPQLHPSSPRVHAVGRPIPETVDHDGEMAQPPIIGSFGFAFPHKGFGDVATEIVDQCPNAVFSLHMPEAFFNGAQGADLYAAGILADIEGKVSNLWYTNDHLAERDLVVNLAKNDVNCLFYAPGQPDAGLSSALDYLIAARRPMLVSEASMFRAAWNRPIWPTVRLGDILKDYDHFQNEANVLYESMAGQFTRDIERIVASL